MPIVSRRRIAVHDREAEIGKAIVTKLRRFVWIALWLVLPATLTAAPPNGLPLEPARTLEREVEAGTWMSLDVSPDGRTMIFDLLGEIYTMPASGGRASLLLGGMAFETQPTYSPDGRWIAFISDRSGSDNLWIAHADGSRLRQLTFSDDETIYASPAWSADGHAVFVSHYRADLNNYALLRQPLNGEQSTVVSVRDEPAQDRADWRSALGAAVSPDGRTLYYARRIGGLDFDIVNRWTIVRRDLASGVDTEIVAGSGGRGTDSEAFFRPQVSPDGRYLAYATRQGGTTELRVRELATGIDRSLGPTEPDQLQSSMWLDLIPRYTFTPDSRAILISHRGGFERRPLMGETEVIPFTAPLELTLGPSTRVHLREPVGPVTARLAMAPISSPDGRRVAFSAFGRIHVQPVDGSGAAKVIAHDIDPAFQPAWSPDGKTVVFVTWSEAHGGAVWGVCADGSGQPWRISSLPAYYSDPAFGPEGAQIYALRSAAEGRRQSDFEIGSLRQAELVAFSLETGKERVIADGEIGGRLQFGHDGQAHILTQGGLHRIDLATGSMTLVAQVKGAAYYFQESPVPVDDLKISPDGQWLVAQVAQQLHLAALPKDGAHEIDLLSSAGDHRQITDIGADYFQFRADGTLEWSVGPQFWQMASLGARPERLADLAAAMPRARPDGVLILRGGRVLTMTGAGGEKAIEKADLVVQGDRIAAVGRYGEVPLPPGAPVLDVSGKTIVPGFIDVHDHIGSIRRNVLSFDSWDFPARLAYGVTTSFDPSTLSIDMLAYQDAVDAGLVLGPRLRSTGPAIFSYNRFTSAEQVRNVLRRYRDAYGLGNIKQYRSGNRRVRQWIADASRELGLLPTTEGALSFKLDLTQMIDGFAGNEHALPAPVQEDVLALLRETRTSYTTTLLITNTGPPALDWFIARDKPFDDAKLARFWPRHTRERRLLDARWHDLAAMRFPSVASDAAALAESGGLVGMGAHGDVPGLGYHWEMEAHVIGGMTPAAVLHAATAGSAETIGRLNDLGTIESGKLADLVILDRDPRVDIRNTRAIHGVMRGGFLYAGGTLAPLWPIAPGAQISENSDETGQVWLPARPRP